MKRFSILLEGLGSCYFKFTGLQENLVWRSIRKIILSLRRNNLSYFGSHRWNKISSVLSYNVSRFPFCFISWLIENGANYLISLWRALGKEEGSVAKPHPWTTGLLTGVIQCFRLRRSKREYGKGQLRWYWRGRTERAAKAKLVVLNEVTKRVCVSCFAQEMTFMLQKFKLFSCASLSFEDTITYTCPSIIFDKGEITNWKKLRILFKFYELSLLLFRLNKQFIGVYGFCCLIMIYITINK